jgi:CelD/BcsL family acetyltransferase involved in cellulose biosynthesis
MLMSGPDIADAVWRKAFCQLYRVRRPCVPLGDIIHWRAVIDALGVGSHLDRDLAYVPSGYFYQTHTQAPTRSEMDGACRDAHRYGARWVLYPVVRQPAAAADAESGGAVELPWFVSAEYEVRRGVDEDLRDQLGGARTREIARLSRRAAGQVTWDASTGEPAPDVLAAFDRLHRLNLERYGHRHNHFARPILAELIRSPLRDDLCVFRHVPAGGGDPVQAVLALWSREEALLHLQVQGIDHARVAPAVNLYATMLYRIFGWGVANGIRRFDLGRGAYAAKLNLGANRFQVVSNLLIPVAPGAEPDDLTELRKAAAHAVDAAVDQLRTTVLRRGAAAHIELPQLPEQWREQ